MMIVMMMMIMTIPIVVTLVGIVTLVSNEHLKKAESANYWVRVSKGGSGSGSNDDDDDTYNSDVGCY